MKKYFFGAAGLLTLILFFGGCNFGEVLGGEEAKEVVWLGDAEVEQVEKFEGSIVKIKTDNGQVKFNVEVVDTFESRKRGLMSREQMDEDSGMLFIFDEQKELGFWMKNTLIPLDVVFIDSSYRITNIKKNAQPCKVDPCETFPSVRPALYVLEINGGLSDELGIRTGHEVDFKL